MSIVCSANCVANLLEVTVPGQEEEGTTRYIQSRVPTRSVSLCYVGHNHQRTNAAVTAEKMNPALRKLGSTLIPASWITITNGDLAAVVIP